jgi:hypothetical protein
LSGLSPMREARVDPRARQPDVGRPAAVHPDRAVDDASVRHRDPAAMAVRAFCTGLSIMSAA